MNQPLNETPQMNDHCVLCGLPVSRATMQQTLDGLLARISRGEGAWLLTLNTEMLSRMTREPGYRELLAQADIITADGMPLVWASKLRGSHQAIPGRTTGVDLVDAYLRLPEIPNYGIIGGVDPATTVATYGVRAQEACRYLFAGKVDLSDEQTREFVAHLRQQKVSMLFLALGVPRGDQLAVKISALMPNLIVIGVGGTFEILGPQGRRAPAWMQKAGMEWLFRLKKEPGRLWRRYLVHYPSGIGLLVRDGMRARRT